MRRRFPADRARLVDDKGRGSSMRRRQRRSAAATKGSQRAVPQTRFCPGPGYREVSGSAARFRQYPDWRGWSGRGSITPTAPPTTTRRPSSSNWATASKGRPPARENRPPRPNASARGNCPGQRPHRRTRLRHGPGPFRSGQRNADVFYEGRCLDGRFYHSVCRAGSCRLASA